MEKNTKIFARETGHCPTRRWETTLENLSPKEAENVMKTGRYVGRGWFSATGAGGCTEFSINPIPYDDKDQNYYQ